MSGNDKHTGTDTHTSLKTPKSQHFPPAQRSQLPQEQSVTFSTFTHRCDLNLHGNEAWQPGKSCFHGGCWRKPSSPQTKGRVLNDRTEVLMRYLAKSTVVAAVIPRAGRFRSGRRGIRKTQSLPLRKTSRSLFHPGV